MRVYKSIQDGIDALKQQLWEAERYHDRYDRIVAAKGDCSVVSGWGGKLPITKARALREEMAGRVVAYKSAVSIMEEVIRQIEIGGERT